MRGLPDASRRFRMPRAGVSCHYTTSCWNRMLVIMNRMRNAWESRTVYSTDHGQMCPTCSKPGTVCDCRKQRPNGGASPGEGIVRIGRETKGRQGKGVTVIRGVPLEGEAL